MSEREIAVLQEQGAHLKEQIEALTELVIALRADIKAVSELKVNIAVIEAKMASSEKFWYAAVTLSVSTAIAIVTIIAKVWG